MQEIKAFIFDMDGVILDSETICDKAWLEVAKKQNLPNPQDVMKQCLGTNKNDTIQILKKNYGADFDSEYFIQQTSDYFHQIEFSSGIPLMPFAKEILDYLKSDPPPKVSTEEARNRFWALRGADTWSV